MFFFFHFQITIDLFLPNPASDVLTTSKSDNSRCIFAINRRPVHLKDMEKVKNDTNTVYPEEQVYFIINF